MLANNVHPKEQYSHAYSKSPDRPPWISSLDYLIDMKCAMLYSMSSEVICY